MYNVEIMPEVYEDLKFLDDAIVKEVIEYFYKYETNPHKFSQPLQSKFGLDLQDCRKTYVANATYRIIIKIEGKTAKIVEVVAVGKRENLEVYKNAHKRVK